MGNDQTIATRYDAVIVGGGHNGLVAAAYLARAGLSVLVLERNDRLGGAAVSTELFAGIDARISRYAYLVSLLPRVILDDLGVSFSTRRRAVASYTPYVRSGRSDALVNSNEDQDRTRTSFHTRTDAADWEGYQRLAELQRALVLRIWPSLLQPLRSRSWWTSSLGTASERAAWGALVDRPLGDTLEGLIHDDLVRGLIFTDAKIGVLTHPQDPTLLQNRCFLLHVMGQGTGEWQVPVGGMGALVNALTTSAREAGARIVTRVTAERVYPGNPRHTIVFNGDGDERETAVEATRVLVNAGPNVFDRLLGRPRVMHGAGEGSVGKVNMLLRRLPRLTSRIDPGDAFRGTFHVDEGYEAMRHSYQQAESGHLPDHPPFEMYCHTLTDASILSRTLRESGHHTLTLFGLDVPYRLFTASNESTKAELLRRYLNALNEYLVDPIEDCLAFDRDGRPCLAITSPVDLERELALDRGNIFHGDVSWFFARDDREAGSWGVETPDDRMYRCGSSASRGGGVSGIPGHNAARRIFEEMGIAQT